MNPCSSTSSHSHFTYLQSLIASDKQSKSLQARPERLSPTPQTPKDEDEHEDAKPAPSSLLALPASSSLSNPEKPSHVLPLLLMEDRKSTSTLQPTSPSSTLKRSLSPLSTAVGKRARLEIPGEPTTENGEITRSTEAEQLVGEREPEEEEYMW